MLLWLLAAFIIVPLVELYLLLQLAEVTSALTTFAVVIVTGVIGSMLARREGAMAWYRFRSALAEGRVPSREIQDGLMIVFAAALLLTPGLLTDTLGFLLLIPAGRDLMRQFVLSRFVRRFNIQVDMGETPQPQSPHQQSPRQQSPRQQSPRQQSARPLKGGYTVDAEAVRRK